MAQSFRIYGGALGEARGYIDCDVNGVTLNGSIELADQDTTSTWQIDADRIASLSDDGLLYDLSNVDTTAEEWGAIDDLEQHYGADADSKGHYAAAAKTLFRGASA